MASSLIPVNMSCVPEFLGQGFTVKNRGRERESDGREFELDNITAKIKAEILSAPLLKVSQISVTTTNGVVRLSGTVDSQQRIARATEIAGSAKDVNSVKNGLVR